jgi:hypothetical protein
MKKLNDVLDETPTENISDTEQLEVKSKWFSVKLDDINGYTLVAMAMILTAMVLIVALLAPA